MNLTKTYRTEMQGCSICFFNIITSIHQTLIIYSMLHTEHMTQFMKHYISRTTQHNVCIVLLKNSIECRIIPSKGENTTLRDQICQAKHIIPLLIVIQISHSYSNDAKGVKGSYFVEFIDCLTGVILHHSRVISRVDL